jgi:hypothetical protein
MGNNFGALDPPLHTSLSLDSKGHTTKQTSQKMSQHKLSNKYGVQRLNLGAAKTVKHYNLTFTFVVFSHLDSQENDTAVESTTRIAGTPLS